jgi:hypothetical protein
VSASAPTAAALKGISTRSSKVRLQGPAPTVSSGARREVQNRHSKSANEVPATTKDDPNEKLNADVGEIKPSLTSKGKNMNAVQNVLAVTAVALGVALSSAAVANSDAKEIQLKDGSTLVIFKDGKMSMRDSRGRPMSMKDGLRMETKDGKVYVMKGNEIWRKTTEEQLRDELYRGS